MPLFSSARNPYVPCHASLGPLLLGESLVSMLNFTLNKLNIYTNDSSTPDSPPGAAVRCARQPYTEPVKIAASFPGCEANGEWPASSVFTSKGFAGVNSSASRIMRSWRGRRMALSNVQRM